jgi:hypothetical protein
MGDLLLLVLRDTFIGYRVLQFLLQQIAEAFDTAVAPNDVVQELKFNFVQMFPPSINWMAANKSANCSSIRADVSEVVIVKFKWFPYQGLKLATERVPPVLHLRHPNASVVNSIHPPQSE